MVSNGYTSMSTVNAANAPAYKVSRQTYSHTKTFDTYNVYIHCGEITGMQVCCRFSVDVAATVVVTNSRV